MSDVYQYETDISSLVMAVESQLEIQSSKRRFKNMTTWDLQVSGEMFFYLYACPGVLNQDYQISESQMWFIDWFTFYNDLFKTSPDMIILTLNRMMKITKDNDFKGKLFKRIAKLLNLKYERIQSLFPGKNRNNSAIKVDQNINFNKDGEYNNSFILFTIITITDMLFNS